ncbi:MAG: cytochrome P450, partial [Pseudonocardia sp.]|nr:cytochrome P450 [Pseudonocardia sp.]
MIAVAASGGRPGELRSPPKLPGSVPWFGQVAAFARDPVGYLRWGRDRAGAVFSFMLLGSRVVVLSGPAAQEAVFRADEALLSPREAYRFMVPVFGEGVAYGTEPAVMDEQLGFVLRALTAKRLQAYAEFMAEEAEAYFGTWGEQGEADLFDAMNELTVRIASRCLVGEEFRARLTDDLPRLYHDLEGGIRLAGLVNPYLPLPSFRRRDRARDRITKVILGIMAERRADGGSSSAEDFITTLMAARYADGSPLPDAIVAGILLTLIFAGQHTSAVLATWAGVLLLEHSKHLPAVLAEQHRLLVDDWSMTLGKLRQMTLLEWCVKEAERMRPPLVVLMRMAMKEFVYGG